MGDRSLLDFVLARLDEDEATARAADVKQGDPEWYATHHIAGHTVRSRRDNRPIARVEDLAGDDNEDVTGILDGRAASEHIARHDPARVLREVEAKRELLEASAESVDSGGAEGAWSALILATVAAIYADHPDYDPEWA